MPPRTVAEELDLIAWLASDEGRPWLQRAAELRDPLEVQRLLRRDLTAEHARAVAEQAELRRRAVTKFHAPAEMLFTRQGLEQSSDEIIAGYKSARFPAGPVLDLCCGIGGDLRSLAQRGAALGVDLNPVIAAIARHNTRLVAAGETGVLCGDVTKLALTPAAAWHLDPDRRAGGGRSTRLEQHAPSGTEIQRLLAQNPQGAIKLAPATEPPLDWQHDVQWEWISREGECRQLVGWFGDLAGEGGRIATRLVGRLGDPASLQVHQLTIHPEAELPRVAAPLRYVYEVDPAVLAASGAGTLARMCDAAAYAETSGYLTSDRLLDHPLLTGFEVLSVVPLKPKPLRKLLAARGIGRVEVKKRGVDLDVPRLERELSGKGDATATLLIARRGKSPLALLTHRLTTGGILRTP